MSNPSNESSPSEPESNNPSGGPIQSASGEDRALGFTGQSATEAAGNPAVIPAATIVRPLPTPGLSIEDLHERLHHIQMDQYREWRRKHLRTAVILFVLTLLSTFLVSSGYFPLEYLIAKISPRFERFLLLHLRVRSLEPLLYQACWQGLEYSVPLMSILFCHEMGHYLQAVRHRVPASLPYFIPMPITPLGTMGAVIFQGRGVATRRQMFDIAVSGPLAGLFLTIPVLWYGLLHSEYQVRPPSPGLEFGEPLLLKWMVAAMHGPEPEGSVFALNGVAFAGWVGILITALNLLPIGQLDGGHILYTLIGRKAHIAAYLVLSVGILSMWLFQNYAFSLLFLLLMLTGVKHPPTANDDESLGIGRQITGWLTLAFLIIGFTPNPVEVPQPQPQPQPTMEQRQPPQPANQMVGNDAPRVRLQRLMDLPA